MLVWAKGSGCWASGVAATCTDGDCMAGYMYRAEVKRHGNDQMDRCLCCDVLRLCSANGEATEWGA